jgi:hypothetical protein
MDIVTDLSSFSDDNTGTVIDEKATANPCSRMDFDSREKAVDMGDQPSDEEKPTFPEGVGQAVHPDGMKSRVAGEYFRDTPCGGIFQENRSYIFSYYCPDIHFITLIVLSDTFKKDC